ncbi:hypothetical protein C8R44DRAFT_748972 [Mycena epipterygia]|nr:hypothetical protein C8R44DRAFT_748972 [Mycena epipterygia]
MCMDNLQLIVQRVKIKLQSTFRMGNIVEMGFALVERWGHVHVKARAQDVNAVGSKFDKEAHIARSTSAAATSNVNKRKESAHNVTTMQYRVKEDVSNDKDFKGAQERFRHLRLDTKVDKLDEGFMPLLSTWLQYEEAGIFIYRICKENKNKKITVRVESLSQQESGQ